MSTSAQYVGWLHLDFLYADKAIDFSGRVWDIDETPESEHLQKRVKKDRAIDGGQVANCLKPLETLLVLLAHGWLGLCGQGKPGRSFQAVVERCRVLYVNLGGTP